MGLSKEGTVAVGIVCLGALVLLGAAIARISGWNWKEEKNPHHIADEQVQYMRKVRQNNLMDLQADANRGKQRRQM